MSNSLTVLALGDAAACCAPLSDQPLSVQPLSVQPLSVQPLSVQPLSQAQADRVAPLLKALADLNEAFDLSQPTISHHLKVLHEAGLLDRDKRGVWVYYRARTEALASLGTLIGSPEPAGTA